jgi:hypothetical protein
MCPTALHGVHTGKEGKAVLRMEVLADEYLRIWSISFGYPGSLNNLSIMARSPLMQRMRNGEWPLAIPEVNIGSMTLSWFYFIVDGIYPRHRIFINSYSKPRSQKEKAFSRQQEGVRKTVERVFAALNGRFLILARPFRVCGEKDIGNIVHSCAALHNAMMEFRKISGDNNGTKCMEIVPEAVCSTAIRELHVPRTESEKKAQAHITADLTENNEHHFQLKNALMEHVWQYRENGYQDSDSDDFKQLQVK